jgi:hypothetical protein
VEDAVDLWCGGIGCFVRPGPTRARAEHVFLRDGTIPCGRGQTPVRRSY